MFANIIVQSPHFLHLSTAESLFLFAVSLAGAGAIAWFSGAPSIGKRAERIAAGVLVALLFVAPVFLWFDASILEWICFC